MGQNSEQTLSVNPAHPDEVVGEATVSDSAAIGAAVARAHEAQVLWRELGIIRRGRVLRACAEEVARVADDLARLLTREEGKPLVEARGELDGAVETIHYHAGHARDADGRTFPSLSLIHI